MKDVGPEFPKTAGYAKEPEGVGQAQLALDRKTPDAELHLRSNGRQCRLRALAAGRAVANNSNVMTALGLAGGDVKDVTKNAADRRPGDVQNLQGGVGGHQGRYPIAMRHWAGGRRRLPAGNAIDSEDMVTRSRMRIRWNLGGKAAS